MKQPTRKHAAGFTLVELIIVIAILSLVASIMIPNLLDSLNKAKQKRTIADIRASAASYMSWFTDQISAGAAGRSVQLSDYSPILHYDISEIMVPTYANTVPRVDGWGNTYDYYLGDEATFADFEFAIRSRGRDGESDSEEYSVGTFSPSKYDEDIVWADGYFIQLPSGKGDCGGGDSDSGGDSDGGGCGGGDEDSDSDSGDSDSDSDSGDDDDS